MDADTPGQPLMDRDAYAARVIALLRAAGITGAIEHDEMAAKLRCEEGHVVDLSRGYEMYRALPAHQRDEVLEKTVRVAVRRPKAPATWAEAKDHVLPSVQPMILAVTTDMRRDGKNPLARHQLTEHLVVEISFPVPDALLGLDQETIERWAVPVDELVAQAGRNLASRGARPWMCQAKFPGVSRSPWNDGFDVSRVLFPEVFQHTGAAMKGDPVVIACTSSVLLVAGSDDPTGLANLGHLGRHLMETEGVFLFFRPMRHHAGRWEHWLPEKGHPGHIPLALLQAWNEGNDYAAQAATLRTLAIERGMDTPVLPPIEIRFDTRTQEPLQVVTWRQGRPTALPKADAVVLVRGAQTLGIVPWDDLLRCLPGELQPMPGYPPRWMAHTFPAPWQVGTLPLEPWEP